MKALENQFALDWYGLHGVRHWGRVRTNGLAISRHTGANRRVVELFAVFHDSRRENEGRDPGHGSRGAALAAGLNGRFYDLDDDELSLLTAACNEHSDGHTKADITVMTCWDADRLDIGRVGSRPQRRYLCTEFAKRPRVIDWAYTRSLGKEML